MRIARSALVSICAALAASGAARAQQLRTVDDSGPADHSTIAAAVLAAGEGDAILVKPGSYGGFAVVGKSLHVQADGPGVHVLGAVSVAGLAAQQQLTLRGLSIERGASAFTASDCAGSVWLEDCALWSQESWQSGAGARATHCAAVTLVRCNVVGAQGAAGWSAGADALRASSSTLALFDCALRGGDGAPGDHDPNWAGLPGGAGLALEAGAGFASACAISGGAGGRGKGAQNWLGASWCGPGGAGGAGAALAQGAQLELLATEPHGGFGGYGPYSCPDGPAGSALAAPPGASSALAGLPVELACASPLREGQTVALSVHGAPGGFALALISASAAHAPGAWLTGPLLLGGSIAASPLGWIPASGALERSFALQELGAAHVLALAQPLVCTPGGACAAGAPSALLLLDAGL